MRSRILFVTAILVFLVTGCSTPGHPSFSAFQKLSPSDLSTFKTQLKLVPIKNLELPTKLPFTTSNVSIVPSVFGMQENIPVSISVGGDKVGLRIVAAPSPSKSPLTMDSAGLRSGTLTKLADGTKAIFGTDGNTSALVWVKDGVQYSLSPSSTSNRPDLSEQQLVQIADSFR